MVILAFFSLIALTPLGLLIVTLYCLVAVLPPPSTLIVTGTLVMPLIVSWSPYIVTFFAFSLFIKIDAIALPVTILPVVKTLIGTAFE